MNEKEYNLYFSKIKYRRYYYPNNDWTDTCELHGDELKSGEILEIKWSDDKIEKHEIQLLTQLIGWNNKTYVPYITIQYGNYFVEVHIDKVEARRLYEPKK